MTTDIPAELPPPYSPRDPNSLDAAQEAPFPTPTTHISLRGGDLSAVDHPYDPDVALYFDERAFQFQSQLPLLVVQREINVDTTRDDLVFPAEIHDADLRDVNDQDWSTFSNYLLAEITSESSEDRDKKQKRTISHAELEERRPKILAVVATWNEGFFRPRSIQFVPTFHRQNPLVPSEQPLPGTSAVTARHPSESSRDNPPQASQPSGPSQPHAPYGQGPIAWAVGAIGRFAEMADARRQERMNDTSCRSGPLGPWGGRGGSFASGRGGSGQHRGGPGHQGPFGRGGPFPFPYGRDGRSPRNPSWQSGGSRHRSASVSSASSISSDSSISSIDSDELKAADLNYVREAIVNFRQDPANKQHLKAAVRQLHSDIRAGKRTNRSRNVERSLTKEELVAQFKIIRAEVRSIKKEARAAKKEKKRHRRTEKKLQKAERKAQRHGRNQWGQNLANNNHSSRSMQPSQGAQETREIPIHGPTSVQIPIPEQTQGVISSASSSVASTSPPPSISPSTYEEQLSSFEAQNRQLQTEYDRQNQDRELEIERDTSALVEKLALEDQDRQQHATASSSRPPTEQPLQPQLDAQTSRYLEHHSKHQQARQEQQTKWMKMQIEQEARRLEREATYLERAGHQRRHQADKLQHQLDKFNAKHPPSSSERSRNSSWKSRLETKIAELRAAAAEYERTANVTRERARNLKEPSWAENTSRYWEGFGRNMGAWGEQFGRNMETWGEQFGRNMERMGSDVGKGVERRFTG